ncbi:MAG: ATP-binding protein [Blastocatellia bacterium]
MIFLFDLERAFPESLGFLDLQREVLAEMEISVVCWVTPFEHREIAGRAPNFYSFRTAIFDFTKAEEMPPAARTFIGRKREIKELTGLLEAGGSAVVAGLGGVGKTGLAQEMTRRVKSHFTGGIAWVNCETKPLFGDIIVTCGVALIGEVVRQFLPNEQRQRLDDTLRDQTCLVVLDNFETIAEDGDVLRWLKTIARPSSALITSRQSVPYLNAPTVRLDALPRRDAVKMFTERAQAGGWEGNDSERVPQLCEMIGNLPLAIELLAPRAAELPLAELMKLVSKNLDSLAREKDPLLAERHQSIAACFRVSFERLTENARNLLMRLSVLPDGASVGIIADFTEIEDWHEPIAECVRHSMLRFDGQRYMFHPLVRRFALLQLGDAVLEWQRRFVAFFAKLVGENDDINDLEKLSVLDAEWRNCLAAAQTAEEIRDWRVIITLSEYLGEFLLLRGLWSEREQLNKQALAAAHNSNDRGAVARALNSLGIIYKEQGKLTEAEEAHNQSLAIRLAADDRIGEGQTLMNLGLVYMSQGRTEEAERAFQQSLLIAREFGKRATEGRALNNLGIIYRNEGKWAEAEEAYNQSLIIKRETNNRIDEEKTLSNLGNVYADQQQWKEAEEAYKQSLIICREFGNRVREGRILYNLAMLRSDQGNIEVALQLGRDALQVLETTQAEADREDARKLVEQLEQKLKEQKGNQAGG